MAQIGNQLEYLEHAGNMLDIIEMHDSSMPKLLETTGVAQHGMATASGLNDYDYQSLTTLSHGQKQLEQVNTVNKVPIPPEVMEHFKHIKCHCMMGLFPEIGRAWLTIDSDIYIWTYEQTRDVAYFDGLNHLIVSVGLVTPKPGVFISDVKHLLILTTPIEIVVLGVTFGDTTKTISSPTRSMQSTTVYEEMQLMNKPIFILNTDSVAITTIKGSSDGRIFLGGRDGFLYEIHYQAESSWFGKRCKKINHSQGIVSYMVPNFLKIFSETDPIVNISIDNSRKLLFVLTEKGAIESWDMGVDCSAMRRLARLSQNDIVYQAENILRTVDAATFKPIKAIYPLTEDDCARMHLIAVTQSGVRFYFSTVPLQTSAQLQPPITPTAQIYDATRPQGLYLMHIRLPPGYTPTTTSGKPKQVHSIYYKQGTFLMISSPQQDQDLLWSISSEPFPCRPYLAESTTILPLDGMIWGLGEVKPKTKSTLNSILRDNQTPRKVVLLTNQGAHIVELLKPVDILQQLLYACHGPQHDAVKSYFQVQSEPQACATSLLIACMEKNRGTEIAMWAAQAFMLYGGEPQVSGSGLLHHQSIAATGSRHFGQTGASGGAERMSPHIYMSTPFAGRAVSSIQQNLMQQTQFPPSPISNAAFTPPPSQQQLPQHQQQQFDPSHINYSAKHAGLYLHVVRLLRPIWKKRCIDAKMCSTINQPDCIEILEDLYSLKQFLETHSVSDLSGSGRGIDGNRNFMTHGLESLSQGVMLGDQKNLAEQAQAEEKRSLTALNFLIKHTCEVMALWKILCEHQFHLLINQMTKDQKDILLACTFRDLVLTRSDTCAFLIVALINSYLSDNASVGSISAKLREVCPNLYRHEDAVSHKATEILGSARTCTVNEEKNEQLRTALQLCKDAAPNLPLTNICQQFTKAKFYQGVIELSATCAAKIDPNEAALHFYRNNEPVEDQDGYFAFQARMNCYKEVKQMLDVVYQELSSSTTGSDLAKLNASQLNAENNFNVQVMKIVSMAIQTGDPLLHVVVYDWLLSHNLLSELLSLTEPTLGEFFKKSVVRNPDNLQLADLLWKYYERNGQHSAAAKILDSLASMQTNSILLTQRIEYLARAVMCMRNDSVGYSVHNGVLLKDLEDKLEIARVQKVILDSISTLVDSSSARESVASLNYTLYNMTELYSEFAEPFELWECKLTILNASHHNDPLLIESVWTNILNKSIEGHGSPMEKGTRLLSKVQLLVKEFGDSGHCFPLAFLVRELEIKCCQLRLSQSLIPEALVAMNLDIELLIDYYSRMISMNERVWANEGNEWHLVQAASSLVSALAQNINQIPNRNRRRVVGKAQELVSDCLNLLNAKPGMESLKQAFRELQIKLQRIFQSRYN